MLATLAKPAPLPIVAALAVAICSAIAVYCLAYSALSGRPEPIGDAFTWAGVNVLPWLLAVEGAKRGRDSLAIAAILLAAFAFSMGLGWLAVGKIYDPAFEAVRRIPGLFAAGAAILLLRFVETRQGEGYKEPVDLPLPPAEIDWVSAAGNYIEINGRGHVFVRRTSLTAVERSLAAHGFVRIHRSILVRRDSIARVRPADVVLRDGTSLKTGKRFRSGLSG
jgi:hypothetical protein